MLYYTPPSLEYLDTELYIIYILLMLVITFEMVCFKTCIIDRGITKILNIFRGNSWCVFRLELSGNQAYRCTLYCS